MQRFDEADSERKKESEEKNSKRDFLAEKSEREHVNFKWSYWLKRFT